MSTDTNTPRTDADNRAYPSPEHAQRIIFEGQECVVMAPEEYEELYNLARQLERELQAAQAEVASEQRLRRTMETRHGEVVAELTTLRAEVAELREDKARLTQLLRNRIVEVQEQQQGGITT